MSAMKPHLFLPILALGLLLAAPLHAQMVPYAMPEHAPAVHDDTPTEGIHVSGEWTLSVYEPDGTFVKQNTFQNALTDTGAQLTANFLNGTWVPGLWKVDVGCCAMLEPSDPTPDAGDIFKNLAVSLDANNDIILQGNFTAPATANIDIVYTAKGVCTDATTAPADCSSSDGLYTTKVLAAPLAVQEGQIVMVKVVLGFN